MPPVPPPFVPRQLPDWEPPGYECASCGGPLYSEHDLCICGGNAQHPRDWRPERTWCTRHRDNDLCEARAEVSARVAAEHGTPTAADRARYLWRRRDWDKP